MIDCRLRPAAVDFPLMRGPMRDGLLARDELDLSIAVDTAGRTTDVADMARGSSPRARLASAACPTSI
ncbi:hypothetical protein ASG25_10260 [Rhizobium sp. Leaf384]|nr:hypothetical protein ASG25_10260 [Rhizobium sp. Leaf384]KQS82609.1 hypothetical protein ASG58_04460 [Rhizobium sp. Leaf383]